MMLPTKQLALELSDQFFQISEIDNSRVELLGSVELFGRSTDELQAEILKVLEGLDINEKYDSYTMSWISHQFTLVPTAIFSTASLEAMYHLCFEKKSMHGEISFDIMNEQSMVVIYEIPDWIKSFFIHRFPRLLIQHSFTHLIRGVIDRSHQKTSIHLSIFESNFHVALFEDKKLLVANSYEYENEDDLIYYSLFCLKQTNASFSEGELTVHLSKPDLSPIIEQFFVKWKKVNDYVSYKQSFELNSLLKLQLSCV